MGGIGGVRENVDAFRVLVSIDWVWVGTPLLEHPIFIAESNEYRREHSRFQMGA